MSKYRALTNRIFTYSDPREEMSRMFEELDTLEEEIRLKDAMINNLISIKNKPVSNSLKLKLLLGVLNAQEVSDKILNKQV